MNPVIELLEDVEILLKSLEKSGIRLMEKPEIRPGGKSPVFDEAKSEKAQILCRNCSFYPMALPQKKGYGTGASRIVFVSFLPYSGVTDSSVLLTKIISAMNLEPGNVYITSILKCLPPPGLIPSDQDISCCMSYLEDEISALKPLAVILLGRFASSVFLGDKQPFESIEGRFYEVHGRKIMPTYHPDDLLKDASKKRNVWEAMKKVMVLIPYGGGLEKREPNLKSDY